MNTMKLTMNKLRGMMGINLSPTERTNERVNERTCEQMNV